MVWTVVVIDPVCDLVIRGRSLPDRLAVERESRHKTCAVLTGIQRGTVRRTIGVYHIATEIRTHDCGVGQKAVIQSRNVPVGVEQPTTCVIQGLENWFGNIGP